MDINVTDIHGYKAIKLSGRVDWESARLVDREIQRLAEDGYTRIIFNLDDVKFICSGGIGALVYNLNRLRKSGGAIYIISDNEYITYLFETLKFDEIFAGYMFRTYEEFAVTVLDKQ